MLKMIFIILISMSYVLSAQSLDNKALEYNSSSSNHTFGTGLLIGVLGGAVIGGVFWYIEVSNKCSETRHTTGLYYNYNDSQKKHDSDCDKARKRLPIWVVGGAVAGGIIGLIFDIQKNSSLTNYSSINGFKIGIPYISFNTQTQSISVPIFTQKF